MRFSFGTGSLLATGFVVALLSGCATPPPASDPEALADFRATNDPLEPTNRVVYSINNGLDTVILRPAALAYRAVLPQPARNSIHNALGNMGAPVKLVNDMLEGKPRRAGDTAMRFLINTSVGVLGLFDVATDWGYPDHDASFGLTFALWDVPEGPYLFLPILGPSNPRDTLGYGLDVTSNPLIWIGQGAAVEALQASRIVIGGVDQRDRTDSFIETTKATAVDPYGTFRSVYRQYQKGKVQKIREDDRATVPVWFPQAPASAASDPH
ncbi:MAG TPA: MlaA family lipoprotein [Rhodopila sp.]